MRGSNAVAHGDTKFKQTDLGPIPADWEVKRLGDVATIARGGSPRPIEDYLTTNPDGVNWVKIGDVGTDAKYIVKTEERIVREGVCKSRMVFPGDFLLSNSMSYGRPYILKISGCIHDGWLVIQDYQSLFDTEFLYYILGSETVTTQYKTLAAGSSVLNLNKDLVSNVLIPLPPLPEQRRIAAALSDVDDLIGALGKLVEKKRAIKTGAMQQLLTGQTRLPSFGGKKFKQTDLGPIPADWEVKRLGDVMTMLRNNTYAREMLTEEIGGVFNVHYGDVLIKFGAIVDFEKDSIPCLKSGVKPKQDFMQDGDLIFADTAEDETVGKACEVVGLNGRKAVSGLHTIPCRPNAGVFASGYLGYFINSATYHNQFLPLITGTKVSSISRAGLASTFVAIPPLPEQRAIAGVLTDMDAEISALEAEKRKYESLKSGMMQQLLTGKVRLR